TVGTDEGRGSNALAVFDLHADAVPFEVESDDPAVGAELDPFTPRSATVEERAVDVSPMSDGVGIAEASAEAVVGRDVDHRFTADRVHHQQALDEDRLLLHALADAERVDRVPGVRRELDTRPDLAELVRLLQEEDAEALDRQSESGSQPADAAAG